MNRRFLFYFVIGLTFGFSVESAIIEDDDDFKGYNAKDIANVTPTLRVLYTGNQLWKTAVNNDASRRVIAELKEKDYISTWGGSHTYLDILVKPDYISQVDEALRNHNISFEVIIDDLQEAIDLENPPNLDENDDRRGHRMTWNAYHTSVDIWGYLEYLSQTYPDLCTLYNIGTSYLNKPIKVLKISNGKKGNKAIWIDGGIHAREWISPASVTYFINHLTSTFETQPKYMQDMDYYIAPLLNPDGYEYTFSVDRMWRKNRRPIGGSCVGTDLNRNFGHKWGLQGASTNPCRETYGGPGPFSEPETRAVKKFIEETPAQWKAYVSFHSYGQYILFPWGYALATTTDHKDLLEVGRRAANAIRQAGGPPYTVGNSATTLYPAAGGSDDWAKSKNMKYSYTIELRDGGRYGFILPAKFIIDSANDALAALRVIVEASSKA